MILLVQQVLVLTHFDEQHEAETQDQQHRDDDVCAHGGRGGVDRAKQTQDAVVDIGLKVRLLFQPITARDRFDGRQDVVAQELHAARLIVLERVVEGVLQLAVIVVREVEAGPLLREHEEI